MYDMQVPTTCIAYYIVANSFHAMSANSFSCDLTRVLHSTFISYHLKDLTRLNRI